MVTAKRCGVDVKTLYRKLLFYHLNRKAISGQVSGKVHHDRSDVRKVDIETNH